MNIDAYLARIDLENADIGPDIDTLTRLQRAHLLTVPFENLDIHWKRPIIVDIDRFYEKIVTRRRGGFCYELNGLFNELLIEIGFKTRLISARVFNGNVYGPEFDHAAIIVAIGGAEYLADVGFGDFAIAPLRYVLDIEQSDGTATYVIRRIDNGYLQVAHRDNTLWKSEYIFNDVPRRLAEFTEMCEYQQTSPDSHFTKNRICSILTRTGRKTLTDTKLIRTINGRREEVEVRSPEHFARLLSDEFGISPLL